MSNLSLVDPPLHEMEKNDIQSGGQDLLPKQLFNVDLQCRSPCVPTYSTYRAKTHNTNHTSAADDTFRGQSDPTILSPFMSNMICTIFNLQLRNISQRLLLPVTKKTKKTEPTTSEQPPFIHPWVVHMQNSQLSLYADTHF